MILSVMMRRVTSLLALAVPLTLAMTPKQMISAPRRSSASPDPSGTWALYTSTTYSFEDHESVTSWNLMRLSTGEVTELPFSDEVSEIVWVGPTNTSILCINGTNEEIPGGITLYTADLADSPIKPTLVASLPAPLMGLKAAKTAAGTVNFVMSAKAYMNNGSAWNEELATTPLTTGMLYDSIYVRHWDAYITQERYNIFSGTLASNGSGLQLSAPMKNLMFGMDFSVTRPESPVGPFFDAADYELSSDGSQVAFLTKAPELPKANYTASYLYLVPHDGSSKPEALNGPGSKAPVAARGASGAPQFSPDGSKLAYFQMDGVYYESDRAKLYVADLTSKEITLVAGEWDRSVGAVQWSPNGPDLWVMADDTGASRLFVIPADATDDFQPKNATGDTSVSAFSVLPDNTALVSASAVWASWLLYTVTTEGDSSFLYRSNEQDAELNGLGPEDVDWFWYNGTLGDLQQAIVVLPEGFDPSKVYDLIFYVHGGPQGYTGNTWSTRWNLKTWADQGYVLVGPNPTGSTSYGQGLTDRIQGKWGGWPYEDLVNAHTYACENLPYVNCSNAVAAGASYGGYMMNWFQGHDLGKEFKALVSHDGVATTYADWSTEELWFTLHEYNGTVWDPQARPIYGMWDPLKHAANFSTPEFVIHSEMDYRLPVSEGVAIFNALQTVGVPSRFLVFPDETHWVLDRENSLFWHEEIFNWINHWSGKIDSLDDRAITM